jgi:hypothetical protein
MFSTELVKSTIGVGFLGEQNWLVCLFLLCVFKKGFEEVTLLTWQNVSN